METCIRNMKKIVVKSGSSCKISVKASESGNILFVFNEISINRKVVVKKEK